MATKAQIKRIVGDTEVRYRKDYSGRGMFNKVSPLAFCTEIHPNGETGLKLRALSLSYDNMGMEYIYYMR